jgi:hypothetical protein
MGLSSRAEIFLGQFTKLFYEQKIERRVKKEDGSYEPLTGQLGGVQWGGVGSVGGVGSSYGTFLREGFAGV